MPKKGWLKMTREKFRLRGYCRVAGILLAAMIVGQAGRANAQAAAVGAVGDGLDARLDAVFVTPNLQTPAPYDNQFPTAPGLDRQIPSPRFTLNFLAPLYFNSNPTGLNSGAKPALETGPLSLPKTSSVLA